MITNEKTKYNLLMIPALLNLFDANTNVTTDTGLTDENKTYYSDYMIDLVEPELVHDRWAQMRPIPKNGGKIVEFRKYDSLPKATTPITEGVSPDGQKMSMSVVNCQVYQYGGYITLSDILIMTAIDNNVLEATKLIASQAGRTLDTITREVLVGGTSVQYAEGQTTSRYGLVGGSSTDTDNMYMTVDCINRATRYLKKVNAKKINGYYMGIVHPSCEYDLMRDPNWKYPHQYVDTSNIYENEIGMIGGTRFVETSEAKIFYADDLSAGARTLTIKTTLGTPGTTVAVDEVITSADATAFVGRKVILNGHQYTVASASAAAAGSATVTMTGNVTVADGTDGIVMYPGEAGAAGRDVYATLILGDNAYGTTEISGGGLEHIVKQLGSAGTADALNQRATVGWKATKGVIRLVEQYMVRIETTSTFEDGSN